MKCEHQGFHTFTLSYDRGSRILTCFRLCDDCGARLNEVSRIAYEPRFDPGGHNRFLPIADQAAVEATQIER